MFINLNYKNQNVTVHKQKKQCSSQCFTGIKLLNNDVVSFKGTNKRSYVNPFKIPEKIESLRTELLNLITQNKFDKKNIEEVISKLFPELSITLKDKSEFQGSKMKAFSAFCSIGDDSSDLYLNLKLLKEYVSPFKENFIDKLFDFFNQKKVKEEQERYNLERKATFSGDLVHELTHVLQNNTKWEDTIKNSISSTFGEDFFRKISDIFLDFEKKTNKGDLKDIFKDSNIVTKEEKDNAILYWWIRSKEELQASELEFMTKNKTLKTFNYKGNIFSLISGCSNRETLTYLINLESFFKERLNKDLLNTYLKDYLKELSEDERNSFIKEFLT